MDNYINVTPYTGKTTMVRAMIELVSIKRELIKSGLLFHQLEGPVTKTTFLGWEIDTVAMTAGITSEKNFHDCFPRRVVVQ